MRLMFMRWNLCNWDLDEAKMMMMNVECDVMLNGIEEMTNANDVA